ncbi:MAG: hypothetical protein RSF83_10145 [Hungatella sp.]
MLALKSEDFEKEQNEAKLELYSLLGEGYLAMKEKRESSIDDVAKRMEQRRLQNG